MGNRVRCGARRDATASIRTVNPREQATPRRLSSTPPTSTASRRCAANKTRAAAGAPRRHDGNTTPRRGAEELVALPVRTVEHDPEEGALRVVNDGEGLGEVTAAWDRGLASAPRGHSSKSAAQSSSSSAATWISWAPSSIVSHGYEPTGRSRSSRCTPISGSSAVARVSSAPGRRGSALRDVR
jgi:hypothetical protein